MVRLAPRPYRVVRAHGGAEALEILRKQRPGAVILDLLMPGMEGDRVLARMRDVWAGVPVIFITGTDEPGIQERLEAAGGCTCLIKPVDPRRLVEVIRAVVG